MELRFKLRSPIKVEGSVLISKEFIMNDRIGFPRLGNGSNGRLGVLPRALSAIAVCLLSFGIVFSLCCPVYAATSSMEDVRVLGRLPLQMSDSERIEFIKKTEVLANITRQKDDVVTYSFSEDMENPGIYLFDEIWPSENALNQHLATTHFKAWWAWVEPHLSGDLVIKAAPLQSFHQL